MVPIGGTHPGPPAAQFGLEPRHCPDVSHPSARAGLKQGTPVERRGRKARDPNGPATRGHGPPGRQRTCIGAATQGADNDAQLLAHAGRAAAPRWDHLGPAARGERHARGRGRPRGPRRRAGVGARRLRPGDRPVLHGQHRRGHRRRPPGGRPATPARASDVAVIDTGRRPRRRPQRHRASSSTARTSASRARTPRSATSTPTATARSWPASSRANSAAYKGIAPGARIVSLKVGTADGGTDVSQVIAAINWVIQHKNDNGLNIRVISLSYGTNSTPGVRRSTRSPTRSSRPGRRASSSSRRPATPATSAAAALPGIANPAYNPFIIGVGGVRHQWAPTSRNDDAIGDYSASSAGCGASCKNPDFVAPGSHIQGLRVPNSWLDLNHPEGLPRDQLLPRQRDQPGGGDRRRRGRPGPPEVPDAHPRPGEEVLRRLRREGPRRRLLGAGRRRDRTSATMLTKTPAAYTQKLHRRHRHRAPSTAPAAPTA